jgi:hypothetical protein
MSNRTIGHAHMTPAIRTRWSRPPFLPWVARSVVALLTGAVAEWENEGGLVLQPVPVPLRR